jgi:hypothetical protein
MVANSFRDLGERTIIREADVIVAASEQVRCSYLSLQYWLQLITGEVNIRNITGCFPVKHSRP